MYKSVSHPIEFLDSGDRVAELQFVLQSEGFDIEANETRLSVFGRSSLSALSEFQGRLGLRATGQLNAADARAINDYLEEQGLLRESRAILRDIGSLRVAPEAGELPPEVGRIVSRTADSELRRLVWDFRERLKLRIQ